MSSPPVVRSPPSSVSLVRPDRYYYHDILWTAWAALMKLTQNIHSSLYMTCLDSRGQRSRSQQAVEIAKVSTSRLGRWSPSSSFYRMNSLFLASYSWGSQVCAYAVCGHCRPARGFRSLRHRRRWQDHDRWTRNGDEVTRYEPFSWPAARDDWWSWHWRSASATLQFHPYLMRR